MVEKGSFDHSSVNETQYPRRQLLKERLKEILTLANLAAEDLSPEIVRAAEEIVRPLSQVPESIKTLAKIVEVPEDELIYIQFEHFNAYERFKPSFGFEIGWDRPEGLEGAAITTLHFGIKDDDEEVKIHKFSPSDIKTATSSFFGFPYSLDLDSDQIPEEDLNAVNQHRAIADVLKDEEFKLTLLEDLVSLFD